MAKFVILGTRTVWPDRVFRANLVTGCPEWYSAQVTVPVEFEDLSGERAWESSGTRFNTRPPGGRGKENIPVFFGPWPSEWELNLREVAGDAGFAVKINDDGSEAWLVGSREKLDSNESAWVDARKRRALEAFALAESELAWQKSGVCDHLPSRIRWQEKRPKRQIFCLRCGAPVTFEVGR